MIITNNIQNHTEVLKKLSVSDAGELAQEVAQLSSEVSALEVNQGAEYDTFTSYQIGDYCIHEGTLYIAKAITSGAWNASKWEPTTITAELKKNEGSGTLELDDSQIMNANGGSWMFLIESDKNILKLHTTATNCNVTITQQGGSYTETIALTSTDNPVRNNLPKGQYTLSTQSTQTSSTYKASACLAQIK